MENLKVAVIFSFIAALFFAFIDKTFDALHLLICFVAGLIGWFLAQFIWGLMNWFFSDRDGEGDE